MVPATLTNRHSTAAVGADFSPWTAGWREPRTRVSSAPQARRAPGLAHRARHPNPCPEPHRGVRGGEVDLDRGGGVLEDRPAAAGVEQARADRERALDRDPLAGVQRARRARTSTGGFEAPPLGFGVGPPRGVAEGVGAGWVVITTSPRSRSHSR